MDIQNRSLLIHFRPMTPEDVDQVHDIDIRSFSMPWSERSYRFELVENRNSVAWVAETAQPGEPPRVVGMIVVWAILDEAHVATIATHPDYRGLGIGQRLLAHGLLAAYERGARLAYLEVRRSNLTAQKLYSKFGFQVVGRRPRYYKDNQEDALLMTLAEIRPEIIRNWTGETL